MRKLSEEEITSIHSRLKSLHIRYTEVYEEIFDHYCTTLENASEVEFNYIFAQLNETFAWSVVKRMDKNLRKASSHQVNKIQLDSLKVWKLNTISLSILLIAIACSLSISYYLGSSALICFVGIIGLVGLTIFFLKYRSTINFSFNIWKQAPINSFSSVIYGRFCLFIGVFPQAFIGFNKLNFDRIYFGSEFFTISNFAFLFLLFYGLSLIKVVIDYQTPKLQLLDKK